MAERLDLQGLLNGSRRDDQFAGLLGDTLAPGSIYGGFLGEQRTPKRVDALQTVRGGSQRLGIDAWDSLFDADTGKVTDVSSLLRTLNAGQTLGQRPMSNWGFQQQYGMTPFDVYRQAGVDQATAEMPASLHGASHGADPFGLSKWLSGLGFGPAHSKETIQYAPEFRFDSTDLGGLDLNNATLDDLNAWAQQTYGVDALTLAASSDELLDTRKKWTADPSLWYDPNDPSVIQATKIPGLLAEDSVLRLGAYSGQYETQQETARQNSARAFQGVLDRALRGDAELGRSAFGQYLTGVVGPSRGYQAPLAQPQDTSFAYQQAIFPEQLQQALAQAGLQF